MVPSENKIGIIIPCFNENEVIIHLIDEIKGIISNLANEFEIIVIDDSSSDNSLHLLKEKQLLEKTLDLTILNLDYNMGHQNAIYQGLLYAKDENLAKVIVLDGDGEDDPNAIKDLVKIEGHDIIYVQRGRRKESIVFRIFYQFYKYLFYFITGKSMNFGNYCMISQRVINAVTNARFLHFAAHLSKIKVNSAKIIYDRRKRIGGQSKMNLNSLFQHAFKSFVEYAEDSLMIFLKLSLLFAVTALGSISFIVYRKLFTDKAILGWASTLSSSFFNAFLICIGFFVIGIILLNISKKGEHQNKKAFQIIKFDK